MRWDIFCRVIDNFGDVGVTWRLARDLASRGQAVRLWLDDSAALAWMAASGAPGVEVRAWADGDDFGDPGDIVVEAFGCDPPPGFVAAMAQRQPPPCWINLEYLSAEDYVERSHGLRSPQPGGLDKWFFYPGFTARTGGLLREPGLLAARAAFDRPAWLAAQGIEARAGERLVSLFCYDNPAIPALLDSLAAAPTLLLLTPGAAQHQVQQTPPGLRTIALPWLAQSDYDRLLWACDLNFVRGEDSLVRAIWAGAPFVWQIYPQGDGVHAGKLAAFLARFGAAAVPGLADLWSAWNGLRAGWPGLPGASAWQRACAGWCDGLAAQDDLATQLLAFTQRRLPG
ncbi:MAG: elongation factor P maturation arginine rhamnosyltransferase EarP [Rubrivivax sp.]|nr:elongation factor P maturation arginine rhamnosyltransferase EarP [Rubrivivax sp.]